MQGKNLLLSLFLGGFGIDRMVNGCYKQGFVKLMLPMVPFIGLPLQGAWWITDVGKAAFGSDGYFYCPSNKSKKPVQKLEKKPKKEVSTEKKPKKEASTEKKPKKEASTEKKPKETPAKKTAVGGGRKTRKRRR